MTPEDILAQFPALRILVIGDLMLDHYVWGEVSRISPEAPVPIVHVLRESDTAGGAANVALNLAALGVRTEVMGCLGDDGAGTRLRSLLNARGIITDRCVICENAPTIVKTRVVARTQQLCRIDHEAIRSTYDFSNGVGSEAALASAINEADAVIVSDYAKGVVTQRLLDKVVKFGGVRGCLVAVDPKPARHLNLAGVGVLTPNRAEALELAGITGGCSGESPPLDEIARRIHEAHAPELLVITLGSEGMALSRSGVIEHRMPTRAREVFDVSGAGDTVIATLTAALAAKASPVDAAHLANLAAGIVVSKFGTATVTPAEVLVFARECPCP
jgi:D-beta-D-heptose 7-phosphate kinase/D-beta-D-heptose 1-phosphate adenosyltransferase